MHAPEICFPFSRLEINQHISAKQLSESFIHQPKLSDLICWVAEVVIQSYLIYTHTSSSCELNKDNFQRRSFKFCCALAVDLLSILFCLVRHELKSRGHWLYNNRYKWLILDCNNLIYTKEPFFQVSWLGLLVIFFLQSLVKEQISIYFLWDLMLESLPKTLTLLLKKFAIVEIKDKRQNVHNCNAISTYSQQFKPC